MFYLIDYSDSFAQDKHGLPQNYRDVLDWWESKGQCFCSGCANVYFWNWNKTFWYLRNVVEVSYQNYCLSFLKKYCSDLEEKFLILFCFTRFPWTDSLEQSFYDTDLKAWFSYALCKSCKYCLNQNLALFNSLCFAFFT